MIYDLSPIVRPDIPVWPGDTPFESRLTWSMAGGGTVNVSAITTTPHLGSHADAPFHTEPRGETMADLPLERYLGPCRVVKVPPQPLIEPRHLEGIDLTNPPRILLKTESVRDRRTFPERFSALSPELAALLAEKKVLLVGLDTPSVDPFDSKTLDAHHALARGGVSNLEGLVLDGVPEGIYELIALPLRLDGLDASPVRAVLRTLES
ncbi:MAG TPA: arylformamidase [Thermoanaerobaculia bacterium]|jgi:arylformamidase|nr:arylformamidase [Thermoanaerobaculia bacterium]